MTIIFDYPAGAEVRATAFDVTHVIPVWGNVPPPASTAGDLVLNANASVSLTMEPTDDPTQISVNGVAATVDPALLADGPVCLIPAVIERVGSQMRLKTPGTWAYDPALGGVHTWGTGWYRNGSQRWKPSEPYTRQTSDATTHLFTWREIYTQGDKVRSQDSNTLQFV